MIKLLVFDVDGTLAPFGGPALPDVGAYLSKWEKMAITIGLSSGKCTEYLMGFARAAGVMHPAAFGESGATLHDGSRFLKKRFADRSAQVNAFAQAVAERFANRIFFQDNVVSLAVFTDGAETTRQIEAMVREHGLDRDPAVTVHHQPDGVTDFLPSDCNKGTSLKAYMDEYGIAKEKVIAIGDGENDLPMAGVAGRFIIVGDRISVSDAIQTESTQEMLKLVDKLVMEENRPLGDLFYQDYAPEMPVFSFK